MTQTRRVPAALFILLILLLVCRSATAQSPTAPLVTAANAFLATLTPEQKGKVLYAFADDQQRARWSNFPTGFVPRGGISLKQMNAPQREAALALMRLVLSPMGFEKVNQIRAADDDFKQHGSKRGPGGGRRGPGGGPPPGGFGAGGPGGPGPGGPPHLTGDLFGGDLYFISLLGKPSLTTPWMLQFGGHHLALNITVVGSRGVLTPTLTGAQPASFQQNGKTIRPLGRESDKAFALLGSLTPKQREAAILPYAIPDLVLGPGQDGKKITPEGLRAAEMTPQQQAALLGIVSEWADILNPALAAPRTAELQAEVNQMWFAWSGPATRAADGNITAYFRIQSPHLVIEYAPQSDEPSNHVHTIYRDPTDDYGQALTHP